MKKYAFLFFVLNLINSKLHIFFILLQKFQSFLEANQNNNEKLWRENHESIIQNKIYELFTNEMGDESVISQGIKKIVLNVHNERSLKENRMSCEDPRTVATQTEDPSNLVYQYFWIFYII